MKTALTMNTALAMKTAQAIMLLSLAVGLASVISAAAARAQAPAKDAVLATVNGRPVLESELKLAEVEIGADLGSLPRATRRRVLVEYLIESALLAELWERAAANGKTRSSRHGYTRRMASRDAYFNKKIRSAVSAAEARRVFQSQSNDDDSIELRARHILLRSEDEAKAVFERIAHGGRFAEMARQYSKDPGSRDSGGRLPPFTRGQMVPAFEQAAFELKPGEVSLPVKTQFGWHLILVESRQKRQGQDFESARKRIVARLIHDRAKALLTRLRARAKIHYHDPQIKAALAAERRAGGANR